MLLNVQPMHIDGLNCREDIFFTVAAHYKREYQLAFSEAFNFKYTPAEPGQSECMGARISTGNDNLQDLLEMYCGFKIFTLKADTVDEIYKTIREQLQLGYPTAISINTYWCPWSRSYQKVNFGHTCLAIDIDSENKITCLDPIAGQVHFYLPYDDFKNGFAYYSTFRFGLSRQNYDYKEVLGTSVEKVFKYEIFNDMERFIEDFESQFNFEEEFKNGSADIWGALLFRNLTYISGSRFLYSQFINYINKVLQNSKLEQVEKEFQCVHNKWKVVISWLLKGYYTGNSEGIHKRALKSFKDILSMEKTILLNLQEAVQNNAMSVQKSAEVSNTESINGECEYTFINLSNYFNSNAFHSTESRDCTADFTGTGHYFLSHNAPSGQIVSSEKLIFRFPEIIDNSCNNISCDNQVITVPAGEYKGILLMGSSEWGNFIEQIGVNYIDGSSDSIQVNFSDWATESPLYDEVIIWGGKSHNKYEGRTYSNEYNLLAIQRSIPVKKELKSITLPDCPNMHIFAATLYK